MARRTDGAMHVATTRRRYKDRVYETHLLRRSVREGSRVRKETLANLSHLPTETIEVIRRSLKGETFVAADETFTVERSLPHGHVAAVTQMANRLGMASLLGPRGRERDVALALVVARVCRPGSKLATTRWWADTTLAADLGLADASTDEVYAAMDWLVDQQSSIEAELASRHLTDGGLVYYDLSSSYVEGAHCELAALGYSRDGKRGKPQINYGLTCDPEGRPVAVEVFTGSTADPAAFNAAASQVRDRFGLDRVVMVGDRGMITAARVRMLKEMGGIDWITALRAPAIKKLAESGALQLSLFDEANLAEISHPDYPGERLVACRNPALAQERARKRSELLAATETELDKIVAAVTAGRLKDAAKIGLRVGKVVNRYKMAKHFNLDISGGQFTYTRRQDAVGQEAALDGIYIIRTSLPPDRLDPTGVVTAYKNLANVERNFRSLKTVDLHLRPIHHRLAGRVRAHVLICMLAAYLLWHLRQAWAPLCFTDEHPPERDDPVAPAQRSPQALAKASTRQTPTGHPVHNLATLLDHLATLTRNQIRFNHTNIVIDKLAQPTPLQARAFQLLDTPIPLTINPT